MKKKVLLLSMCFLALLTAGCQEKQIPKLENGEEIVIEIDGKKVTANELYDNLKGQYGASAAINLVDKYIADKEIEDNSDAEEYAASQIEAIQLSYKKNGGDLNADLLSSGYSSIEDYREVLTNNYKMNQVVEKYLADNLTEKEINKYYKDEISGSMTVRHILIKPTTTSGMTEDQIKTAEEEALKEAKDLIKKLDEGAKFEELAKENSDDGTASEGGLYANFTKTQVVTEFWDASIALKDGEYSKTPVKTQYGYHIILRISQEKKPSLDDALDTVKEALVEEKMKETNASLKVWAKLRKQYNINIYDTDINRIYRSTTNNY